MIAIDDDDDGIAAIGDTAVNASTVAIFRNDDVIISTVETSDSSGDDNIMVWVIDLYEERRGEFSGGGYAPHARCNGKAPGLPQDKRIEYSC